MADRESHLPKSVLERLARFEERLSDLATLHGETVEALLRLHTAVVCNDQARSELACAADEARRALQRNRDRFEAGGALNREGTAAGGDDSEK